MAKVSFLTFYNEYSVGVYILSSILKNSGHDVSIIFFKLPAKRPIEVFRQDANNYEMVDPSGDIIGFNADVNKWENREVELLINKIIELSPDVLCISSRSPDRELIQNILPIVKSKCNVMTIAGGFGPTLEPELYLEYVDYVFIGEAENIILELIHAVEEGESIKEIDNICYKKNGNLVKNKIRVPDISLFKFQKIPVDIYYIENNNIYDFDERGAIISTHAYSTFYGRGCISSCSYCSAGNWTKLYAKEGIHVKKRRNRQVEDIIEELINVKDHGYTFVHFRDEFMFDKVDTLKRFFHLYEREICLPFWAFLVPEQVLAYPELLEMAADAGFVDTEIGFQSGSDRINRKIFNRFISNRKTLEYAKLLARYDINVKYDFIIFNPAESIEDINMTFDLIQALPKKRCYLQVARLHPWPMSPIIDILKDYQISPEHYDYYYRIGLLYHLCFVVSPNEFKQILSDKPLTSSSDRLRAYYKSYLKEKGVEFPIGTHDVPESITTHRYQRILKKRGYNEVIVWGADEYFVKLSHIFNGVNIRYLINDLNNSVSRLNTTSHEVIRNVTEELPIFVCSERKKEIKMYIKDNYPEYKGIIYV